MIDKYKNNDEGVDIWNSSWSDNVEIKNYNVKTITVPTGYVTIQEGIVDDELIDNSYYTTLNDEKYRIEDVEFDVYNKTVIYFIDKVIISKNNDEESRLKAVEDWFVSEYSDYKKFSELNNNRYDKNEIKDDLSNKEKLNKKTNDKSRWKNIFGLK